MNCKETEGRLTAFECGELSPDLHRAVKKHLKGCAKCRGRLVEFQRKELSEKNGEALPDPAPINVPEGPSSDSDLSPFLPSSTSPRGRKEFVGLVAIFLAVGAGIYIYGQFPSDSKSAFFDEKAVEIVTPPVAAVVPSSGIGAPPPASPSSGGAPNAPIMPMKVHKETTQALSKEARRRAHSASGPAQVKIVLISRDQTEAADLVEARAVESEGRLLRKKKGATETRMVVLIPARRYDGFFKSLQTLGPTQEVIKKKPTSEGSVTIEVTVE